jgi:hypothetical protein
MSCSGAAGVRMPPSSASGALASALLSTMAWYKS